MKVKIWGARGSVPAPGPETTRYGGNTSCVQITLDDGTVLVLDAGTGIRSLGVGMPAPAGPLHILLTHLHLDHIQGLMFFAPAFRPEAGDPRARQRTSANQKRAIESLETKPLMQSVQPRPVSYREQRCSGHLEEAFYDDPETTG